MLDVPRSSILLVLAGLAALACGKTEGKGGTASAQPSATVAPRPISSGQPGAPPRGALLYDYSHPKKSEIADAQRAESLGVFAKGTTLPADCNAKSLELFGALLGSFTKKGLKETALLVGGCADATYLGIVGEGGKLIVSHKVRERLLDAVFDVNKDGVDELMISGNPAHGGVVAARLVSLEDRKLVEVRTFGDVVGPCTDAAGGKAATALAIYVTPGTPPEYTTETRTLLCK